MEAKEIQEYWEIVLRNEQTDHYLKPLSHLQKYLAAFNIIVDDAHLNLVEAPQEISVKPAFKNLTDEILLRLRYNIYYQMDTELLSQWAEKLMRFCEVRYHELKKRAVAKLGNPLAARLHFLHLMVFLMDYGLFSRDARYLNLILKLSRQHWAFKEDRIKEELRQENSELLAGLFQFRLLVLKEYALEQISKRPTL